MKADLKFLGYKTAFLLALTTASRVSELHAIDVRLYVLASRMPMSPFAPSLGFLSNTQTPEDTQRTLARIYVKSLWCEAVDDRMS
jgi:hypothetical protein